MLRKIFIQVLSILFISLAFAFAATLVYQPANYLLFGSEFESENDIIDLHQAKKIIISNAATWIDARPERFYDEGHLPGAINIPLPGPIKYRREIFEKWEKDKLIITYCSNISCPVARHLATEMKFMGFTNVKVFAVGYDDWEESGLPLEESGMQRAK